MIAPFPGKFIFAQMWTKKAPKDPKIEFSEFFKKFCH